MIMMAIIGGSGFDRLADLDVVRRKTIDTPYGAPSATLEFGRLKSRSREWVFLPRHGATHAIPPHRVNYRANIHALKQVGVKQIVALAAVGGITPKFTPGLLALPHQLIDYTWGRQQTFFDDAVTHIDFSEPYSSLLRGKVIEAASIDKIDLLANAVYAATQGPRLETAAEIDRLERDGADIVGMTGMPEAALARELEIEYATIAIVVNFAAGRGNGGIDMQGIRANLEVGTRTTLKIIKNL